MVSRGMQAEIRQFVPLIAAVCILSAGVSNGQEKFPNELNSPIDEPQVVIHENHKHLPIRPASVEITQSKDPLVKLVYETREAQRRRLLSTSEHTPWQIMHGLLGLRQDFLISHNGQPVSGLQWIQTGPLYQNESWFEKTTNGGRAHPFNKPYWFEGHINQFLAIIAMCNVPLDAQFGTPQGPITMRDMLKNAQMTANEQEEVTWTLWALCTYLPSDAEWINAKGEKWSIERLVRLEVGKRVGGPTSPCGGTHGLFALARARNVYLRSGRPLRGVWLEADQKIQKYIETARMQQNQDGTLSSNFFRGREYKQDFDKRMASCGHLLEFLMMALPQERLNEPWIRKAIEATANDLMANRKAYVSCSPLYHATDALSIYLDRVAPSATPQQVAQKPGDVKSISSSKDLKASNASISKPQVPPVPVQEPNPDRPDANHPQAVTKDVGPQSTTPQMIPEKNRGSENHSTSPAATPAVPTTAEPTTAEPTPAVPTPAVPTPAEPTPAEPTPAVPTPAVPTPAVPTPAVPTPAVPTPAVPTPAVPTPAVPTPAVPTTAVPTTAVPTTAVPTTAVPTTAEPSNVKASREPASTFSTITQSLPEESLAPDALLPVPVPGIDEPGSLPFGTTGDSTVNQEQLSALSEVISGAVNATQTFTEVFLSARAKTVVSSGTAKSTCAAGAEPLIRSSESSSPKPKQPEDPASGKLSDWKATLPNRRTRILR